MLPEEPEARKRALLEALDYHRDLVANARNDAQRIIEQHHVNFVLEELEKLGVHRSAIPDSGGQGDQ